MPATSKHNYRIQIKVYGSAQFWDVEINGYKFDSQNTEYGSVLITKTVKASNYKEAIEKFYKKLLPMLDALCLHRLSAISTYGSSIIIAKPSQKIIFSNILFRRNATGLSLFDADKFDGHFEEIKRLTNAREGALFFFRHAVLSENIVSQTLHLLQACECIADKKRRSPKCPSCGFGLEPYSTINHDKLNDLLGESLYRHYFQPLPSQKNSIRNQLAHGECVEQTILTKRIGELIEALKKYFIDKYNLEKIPDVAGFRGLYSHDQGQLVLKYKKQIPSITDLQKLYGDNAISPEDFGASYMESEEIENTMSSF